jgi:predicted phosphodiesterase
MAEIIEDQLATKHDLKMLLAIVAMTCACNNLNFDGIRTRFKENFAGSLSAPGNIDPAGTNSFTFAVMGDTHVGLTATSFISSAVTSAKNAGDAFVLIAGDLTNLGKADEFNAFIGTMNAVGLTYRSALGNHDLYFDGWNNFKQFVGRSIYSFDADNVHISVLDSGNATLGEAQLNWLRADLAATAKPLKIVVSHYAPISGPLDNLFKMASEEESAILKNVCHQYSVNYMIAGHYHGYRENKLGNTTYIVTGGVNSFLDPGNSNHFVRLTVSGNSITHQRIEL